MGLETKLGDVLPEVITTRLDALVNWGRKSSIGRQLSVWLVALSK